MVPDWQTNVVYVSALLGKSQLALWASLKQVLVQHGVEVRLLQGTKDVWARDYMPIQVDQTTFVKFVYQPDYLRGYEHLSTGEDVCRQFSFLKNLLRSDIRLDGGNVVASSRSVILTEKVFRENPSWSRKKIRETIQRLLQVEECIFIPTEPGDRIGHADGVVRFLNDDRVVINDYSKLDPGYGNKLIRVLKLHRLHVEVLPYAVEEKSRRNELGSAVGNHVNFLRIGNLLVMPVYGVPQDDEAIRRIRSFLPGTNVVPLPSSELAQEGGVLNCVSWSLQGIDPVPQNPETVGQQTDPEEAATEATIVP